MPKKSFHKYRFTRRMNLNFLKALQYFYNWFKD